MHLSPLNQRRFARFKANKRGWWSLWLFLGLFIFSLGAELIANDKPLVVQHDGQWFFPVFKRYPETYKIPVYPTHRTVGAPAEIYESAKRSALNVTASDEHDMATAATSGVT